MLFLGSPKIQYILALWHNYVLESGTWILHFKMQIFLFFPNYPKFSQSSSGNRVHGNELHCLQALAEEKVAYERSTSRNIYLNVAVNTLKKLRSLVPNSPSSTNSTYHVCGLIRSPAWIRSHGKNLLKRQTHFSEALCWKANNSS